MIFVQCIHWFILAVFLTTPLPHAEMISDGLTGICHHMCSEYCGEMRFTAARDYAFLDEITSYRHKR